MAKGKYEGTKYGQGQLHNREGIVIRPVIESYSEVLRGRMSFKVLNTDYLLREDNDDCGIELMNKDEKL